MCFLFICLSTNVGTVFAFNNEILEFYHNNKVFTYNLIKNIKTSSQFDLNIKLNKYNRFSSIEDRKKLLQHLLNIGIDTEVALNYVFPNLCSTISTIEKNVYVEPKNAHLKTNVNSESVFNITPEIVGKQLDKNVLYANVCKNYLSNSSLKFNVPIIETFPKVSAKDYESYTNLRADFSTNISTSSLDRKHNIKNALNSINKTILMPNETFSFNKTVGKRSEENGYRNAKIIVNNEFVDGIGGGVCQVSSTLYNAALLSGLEIVEANKHSKQVGYVKYGFDAMVNFGSSDLKFKNNTNNKIVIITNFSPTKIRIRIFGTNLENTYYKLTNELSDIVHPTEEIIVDTDKKYADKVTYQDEYFYLKTASKGITIKSYREKYVNNKLTDKKLLRTDKYTVQNATKVYGSTPRESSEQNLNYSFSLAGWI